jgi:short-subunit dehydrogenase
MGVVYGVETFVPLIQTHKEGGHIINTASMAGHLAAPAMSPYNATKFAVVGYSETIKQDLEKDNIGVSVLCPAWVRTDIHNTGRNKPSVSFRNSDDKLGRQDDVASGLWKQVATAIENGLDPNLVAEWTIESILENKFYIFTHPEMREMMAQRFHLLDKEFSTLEQDKRFLKRT